MDLFKVVRPDLGVSLTIGLIVLSSLLTKNFTKKINKNKKPLNWLLE